MENGKYVVENDTGDFEWNGFLVNGKHGAHEGTSAPPPPYRSQRMAVRTNPNPRPREFRYVIRPDGFDELYGLVRRIPTP